MFKKILITTVLVATFGVLTFGAVTRMQAKTEKEGLYAGKGGYGHNEFQTVSVEKTSGIDILGQGADNGYGQGAGAQGFNRHGANGLENNLPAASGELSAAETAALIYMREEEKLAHDVYVALYAQWNLPVFQNISQSEQTHADAVKTLLDRYELSDPALDSPGAFTDPVLQALYDDLMAQGSQSMADALKVGAVIEEIDILDLKARLEQTDNADIQQVFNNLLNGSSNHLRAFTSTLNTQTGETYQPQYLSAEDYQAIISAAPGRGHRRGGGRP